MIKFHPISLLIPHFSKAVKKRRNTTGNEKQGIEKRKIIVEAVRVKMAALNIAEEKEEQQEQQD